MRFFNIEDHDTAPKAEDPKERENNTPSYSCYSAIQEPKKSVMTGAASEFESEGGPAISCYSRYSACYSGSDRKSRLKTQNSNSNSTNSSRIATAIFEKNNNNQSLNHQNSRIAGIAGGKKLPSYMESGRDSRESCESCESFSERPATTGLPEDSPKPRSSAIPALNAAAIPAAAIPALNAAAIPAAAIPAAAIPAAIDQWIRPSEPVDYMPDGRPIYRTPVGNLITTPAIPAEPPLPNDDDDFFDEPETDIRFRPRKCSQCQHYIEDKCAAGFVRDWYIPHWMVRPYGCRIGIVR